MNQQEENRNVRNLLKLLETPYFDITPNYKTIISRVIEKDRDSVDANIFELDDVLELGHDRRKWHKIDLTDETNLDKGYSLYYDIVVNSDLSKLETHQLFKGIPINAIFNYDVYKKGKITLNDGVERKLFKFLLKMGIIDKYQMDKLNVSRVKQDKVYICLSRNPVDYIFCSTGQSFDSCLTEGKPFEYYHGLIGATLDPNRLIIFATSRRRPLEGTYREFTFYYYKYIARSWGIWLEKKRNRPEFGFVKSYGTEIDLYSKIKELGYEIFKYDELEEDDRSQYACNAPTRENGSRALIYLDDFGLDRDNFYRPWYGMNLDEIRHCVFCGISMTEDYYETDDGEVCQDCFDEHFFACANCGVTNDIVFVYDDPYTGNLLCERCFHEMFGVCAGCKETIHHDQLIEAPSGDYYCEHCFYDFFDECYNCLGIFELADLHRLDDGRLLCSVCYEGYLESTNKYDSEEQETLF